MNCVACARVTGEDRKGFGHMEEYADTPALDPGLVSAAQAVEHYEIARYGTLKACYERGSYLAFLGRLTAEKGPEAAIRVARAAQMPLRIAAKLPRGETVFFKTRLEPHIDGKNVQLVGEVDDQKKQPFLANAAALLFPITWPEPFGLVMMSS